VANELTKEDLKDLRLEMREGFKGVHDRQDKTNGRVNSAHELLREQGAKIRNLEQEVFDRRRHDRDDPDVPEPVEDAKRITQRDVRMVIAGATGVVGFTALVWKVLPVLLKALVP
jgi:hypothetical protein